MVLKGISRQFVLTDNQQYDTIGRFWDEMAALYGLERLWGLGYNWQGEEMAYAIGLKDGCIDGCNISITLPDDGWVTVEGETDCLEQIYDDIYKDGALLFEIETFYENGRCEIRYYREK